MIRRCLWKWGIPQNEPIHSHFDREIMMISPSNCGVFPKNVRQTPLWKFCFFKRCFWFFCQLKRVSAGDDSRGTLQSLQLLLRQKRWCCCNGYSNRWRFPIDGATPKSSSLHWSILVLKPMVWGTIWIGGSRKIATQCTIYIQRRGSHYNKLPVYRYSIGSYTFFSRIWKS